MNDEPGDGKRRKFHCSLCGKPSTGFGHNPEPLGQFEYRCCDDCNTNLVIPERLRRMSRNLSARGDE
jgi:hypothetical protein